MPHVITIDQSLCRGCNLCLDLCPRNLFQDSAQIGPAGLKVKEVVSPEKCTGCGLCELCCPGAISLDPLPDEVFTRVYEEEKRSRVESHARGGWKEVNSLLTPGRYFMTGNDAVVEASLAAGCRFFAGYPITPANEILEGMSRKMRGLGGKFIQAEDEIASVFMVLGASWAGLKALTATAGPGFALMQEGLSLADMAEVPCVIVNVQRAGPSTGQATRPAAMDIREARYGSHGGVQRIALYPDSVQETFDLTIESFNLAERFRTPVILLSDGYLSHLSEKVEIGEHVRVFDRVYVPGEPAFGPTPDSCAPSMPRFGDGEDLQVTGSTHDRSGRRSTADPSVQEDLVFYLDRKILAHREELVDCEEMFLDDAEVVVVAFGTAGRSAKWAVKQARRMGKAVGLLRPRIVYPFPTQRITELSRSVARFVVP
ncbi:MAG: 4Fe-4S binding protein, partial [Dehalococcoidia bacterium]